jgi:O-antigen ligase
MDWTPIDTDQYKLVEHTQDIKELSWPVFWVQAGSPFYFVPVQSITGEYVFPFVSSSVGERLEMWRAAWHIFLQHPLLGAGTGSFLDEVAKRVRSGDIFLQVLT